MENPNLNRNSPSLHRSGRSQEVRGSLSFLGTAKSTDSEKASVSSALLLRSRVLAPGGQRLAAGVRGVGAPPGTCIDIAAGVLCGAYLGTDTDMGALLGTGVDVDAGIPFRSGRDVSTGTPLGDGMDVGAGAVLGTSTD